MFVGLLVVACRLAEERAEGQGFRCAEGQGGGGATASFQKFIMKK